VLAGVARLADLAATTDHQRLLLVPGDPHLANADRALGRAALPQLRLRAALTGAHPHGLVLLDCPPSLGLVAVNALAAARAVLIPVAAQAMELDGLAALHETLAEVRSGLDHPVFVFGILACRVRPTRLGRDVVATLRAEHAGLVLETVIRENVRVAEAYAWRQPVSVYAPHSASAVDYRAATKEIAERLRQ
jgi:chromosome partitioning protein